MLREWSDRQPDPERPGAWRRTLALILIFAGLAIGAPVWFGG